MNDNEPSDRGTVTIIDPTPAQWRQAAYLQLMPYDCTSITELDIEDSQGGPIPMLGRVRMYSVEIVYQDDKWDHLYLGRDMDEAKALIEASAAKHDLPIRRLYPKRSDIAGY